SAQLRAPFSMVFADDFILEFAGSIPLGVLMLDEQARVVRCNQAARVILASGSPVKLEDGRLAFERTADSLVFKRYLSLAVEESHSCAMPVARDGGPPMTMLIAYLGDAGQQTVNAPIAVFIGDSALRPAVTAAKLRKFFGLTASEARLG